jgi:hypothetical protein
MTKKQLMKMSPKSMVLMFGEGTTSRLHLITIRSSFKLTRAQEFLESRASF